MTTKYTQFSLPDTFHDCQKIFTFDNPTFFSLLQENLDISDFIPLEFFSAFYKSLGRKYSLDSFLSAFFKNIHQSPSIPP